jgi:hypothetical protein
MSTPIEQVVDRFLSRTSKSKQKSLHDPTRVITEREKHAMWIAHMQEILALDPTNEGRTIIMSRKGRTHRFVIPAYRLPTNSTTP